MIINPLKGRKLTKRPMFLNDIMNGLNNNIITVIYLLLIVFSIIVLTRINPMISLFNMIVFYVLLGLLLYKLNLNVLGILYILIYVGAISVLFIFILSLINIKYNELYYQSYSPDILLIIYSFVIFTLLLLNIDNSLNNDNFLLINNILSYDYISNIMEFKIIGELLYTQYSVLFLLLGIILLLSIVAAIVLIYRV